MGTPQRYAWTLASITILGCVETKDPSIGSGADGAGDAGSIDNCPDIDTAEIESEVFGLVNAARSRSRTCGGQTFSATTPLQRNGTLDCVARSHSADMAERKYFDHTDPDGNQPQDRMTKAGYGWMRSGENIAAGQTSADMVMQSWLESPGHCSNIMSPEFQEIGIGLFLPEAGSAQFPAYWTQVFGTPF